MPTPGISVRFVLGCLVRSQTVFSAIKFGTFWRELPR